MTASRTARRSPVPPPARHTATPSATAESALLWPLATLLMLGNSQRWVSESAAIVDLPVRCTLVPDGAWSVPLGLLSEYGLPVEFPVWITAVVGGGLIALMSRRLAATAGIAAGLLALVGWALVAPVQDFIAGLLILGVAQIAALRGDASRWRLPACLAVLALAPLLVLEFGWVWLSAAVIVLPGEFFSAPQQQRRLSLRLLLGFVVVAAGVAAVHPGFGPALMRPVNWFWLRPSADVLPSAAFAFSAPVCWLASLALCGVLAVCGWRRCGRPTDRWPPLFATVFLSAVGLACGRYLWLSTWTLAALLPPAEKRLALLTSRRNRLLVLLVAVLAGSRPLTFWPSIVQETLGSGTPTGVLEPAEWPLAGPVLLTNLDECREWETPRLRSQYRLLVNDRWDIFGDIYPRHEAVCRDMIESRSDRYLRSDGEWGGYTRWIKEWEPALMVVGSDRLDDLRQLSLCPDWSVLGIDGHRTILARTADSQAQLPLRKASATLYRLEWPGMSGTPLDENVIVVVDPDDHRRAALALVAIRLPYAALRVLRSDPATHQPELEAICYLELAHRAVRYAGCHSLVDQVRAVSCVREAHRDGWHSSEVQSLVARSLATLGLVELAREVAPRRSRAFPTGADQSESRAKELALELAMQAGRALPQTSTDPAWSRTEQQFRQELPRGELIRCQQLLEQLDPSTRPYYSLLVGAATTPPDRTAVELRKVLDRAEFPLRLRGEANFYLGCQAIEAGDPPTAANALSQSAEIEPTSPFAPLRSLYYRQIVTQ